ncbi:hypothetical protein ABZ260_01685 [Streptosporangium sp. NPDC006013]|uniref:hypothetical protein n=1 Tax=Streptosporangium sp. NPDC006013 TaxID=3155596 RepID=UPI0033BC74CC
MTLRDSARRGDSFRPVRVQGDGGGLPAAPRPGIGLASTRERAAEPGGTCVIGPASGGGTVVEAVLPITIRRETGHALRTGSRTFHEGGQSWPA